jgi:DNA-binding response OmpR family regulator
MSGELKKMILAIDDEKSIRDFYATGLKLLGFNSVCAESAGKAKEILASQKPDLMLIDVMMPDQDGISLTKELHSDPKTSGIPIIIISGLADAGTLNDALLFGAADYLVKPVDLDALELKIKRVFEAAEHRNKKKP